LSQSQFCAPIDTLTILPIAVPSGAVRVLRLRHADQAFLRWWSDVVFWVYVLEAPLTLPVRVLGYSEDGPVGACAGCLLAHVPAAVLTFVLALGREPAHARELAPDLVVDANKSLRLVHLVITEQLVHHATARHTPSPAHDGEHKMYDSVWEDRVEFDVIRSLGLRGILDGSSVERHAFACMADGVLGDVAGVIVLCQIAETWLLNDLELAQNAFLAIPAVAAINAQLTRFADPYTNRFADRFIGQCRAQEHEQGKCSSDDSHRASQIDPPHRDR
jgi:hypothetical protein